MTPANRTEPKPRFPQGNYTDQAGTTRSELLGAVPVTDKVAIEPVEPNEPGTPPRRGSPEGAYSAVWGKDGERAHNPLDDFYVALLDPTQDSRAVARGEVAPLASTDAGARRASQAQADSLRSRLIDLGMPEDYSLWEGESVEDLSDDDRRMIAHLSSLSDERLALALLRMGQGHDEGVNPLGGTAPIPEAPIPGTPEANPPGAQAIVSKGILPSPANDGTDQANEAVEPETTKTTNDLRMEWEDNFSDEDLAQVAFNHSIDVSGNDRGRVIERFLAAGLDPETEFHALNPDDGDEAEGDADGSEADTDSEDDGGPGADALAESASGSADGAMNIPGSAPNRGHEAAGPTLQDETDGTTVVQTGEGTTVAGGEDDIGDILITPPQVSDLRQRLMVLGYDDEAFLADFDKASEDFHDDLLDVAGETDDDEMLKALADFVDVPERDETEPDQSDEVADQSGDGDGTAGEGGDDGDQTPAEPESSDIDRMDSDEFTIADLRKLGEDQGIDLSGVGSKAKKREVAEALAKGGVVLPPAEGSDG